MTNKEIKIAYKEYASLDELSAQDRVLAESAIEAVGTAYAPYSKFNVGAAVRFNDGQIIKGSNQENAAYPSGICAERTALFTAVTQGYKAGDFKAIAVAGETEEFLPPCSICRQVMIEFCDKSMPVILTRQDGETKTVTLDDLVPFAFDSMDI